MSSQISGGDLERLKELRSTLEKDAARLKTIVETATSATSTLERLWLGLDAGQFKQDWSGKHRPLAMKAVESLREAAATVERNRAEQEHTSAADGSTGSVVAKEPGSRFGFLTPVQDITDYWAERREVRQQVEAANALSPAEQATWWTELSNEERAMMHKHGYATLMGMEGLPDDIRRRASRHYVEKQMADDIALFERDAYASIEVDVKLVSFGVEGHATTTEMANGEVEVELSLEGEVGRKFGGDKASAEIGVEGGVRAVYRFDNREEADAFLNEFRDAVVPGKKEMTRTVTGIIPGVDGVATDAVKDGLKVLDKHSSDHEATIGHIGLYGGFEAEMPNIAKAEAFGHAGVEHNFTTGENSLYAKLEVKGELEASGYKADGSISAEANLTLGEGNRPKSLELDLTTQASGGVDVADIVGKDLIDPGLIDANQTAGVATKITITTDLQDPEVQAAAEAFIDDPSAENLKALVHHSDVVIQADVRTQSEAGFDAKVVKGEVGVTETQNVATVAKPAGGKTVSLPEPT